MKTNLISGLVALAIIGVSGLVSPAGAQEKAVGKGTGQPTRTDAMKLSKAAETWAEVLIDRRALDAAVKAGNLPEVHDLAFSIRDAVVTLPYKSAALAPAKRKALDAQVQNVAAIAEELDRAADAGNLAATRLQHRKLNAVLDAIAALYPANALPTIGARPMTAAERALFLTPGGAYTAADIKANGNTSVYQKYPDFVASHDTQVKPGEAVCPISETKPNPKLTWVVGGKTYQFCCPPCVAEFVAKAKKDPKGIKAPEGYVKR
jgi:YHS domain-containing protein